VRLLSLRHWAWMRAVAIVAVLIAGCGSTSVQPESEISPVFTDSSENPDTTEPPVKTEPSATPDPPVQTENGEVTVPPRQSPP
jgi:hypothetical protein